MAPLEEQIVREAAAQAYVSFEIFAVTQGCIFLLLFFKPLTLILLALIQCTLFLTVLALLMLTCSIEIIVSLPFAISIAILNFVKTIVQAL